MTTLVCHLARANVPSAAPGNEVHVLLYDNVPVHAGTAAIGGQLRDAASRFGVAPSSTAMDFVSIALAVTAADTFVLREGADNGWSRSLRIVLPLHNPHIWRSVRSRLEDALRFLSGDVWSFEFLTGGEPPPSTQLVQSRVRGIDISKVDCISLFSGGLDSGIAALDLVEQNKRPLLVSHAYRGDAKYQQLLKGRLPSQLQHFSVNAYPTWSGPSDESMRTRSFNFLAFAALAAQTRSAFRRGTVTNLLIPENGLIALNAPLTPRRIGALSTRTTHPHFLASLQNILDEVEMPVAINNLYEAMTKGEMVASKSNDANFTQFASETVSCGKWKRANEQCGRCVPCLIRRAALYAGGVDDQTRYESPDLHQVIGNEGKRDDLIAVLTAARRLGTENLERWVGRSGPLPSDSTRRASLIDVHRRGITELRSFLQDSGFAV
jgi:hypothetical protein